MIRQTNPSFDERAYGFANLVDLLRAAHKDGLVRVDRDRQGVIRVFQGNLTPEPVGEVAALAAGDEEPLTVESPEVVEVPVLVEAVVVDTQAEPAADEVDAIDVEINGNVVSNEPPLARGRRRRPRPTGATQRPAAHPTTQRAPAQRPARSRRSRKP